LYRFCCLNLDCNVPLGIPLATGGAPDWVLELTTDPLPARGRAHWLHVFPESEPRLHLGKLGRDYLLSFAGLADFVISPDGARIRGHAESTVPERTLRHLILDQVLPRVLGHRGNLVLHASAVAGPQGAVAFVGAAGLGKSTLATGFWQQGFRLVADDCLLLSTIGDAVLAVPSYPGVRLWEDAAAALSNGPRRWSPVAHYTDKLRLELPDAVFRRDPAPLIRIYCLAAPDPAPSIMPLSTREAVMALVGCSYRLDLYDRRWLGDELERLCRLALTVPARRLIFPRDFRQLPAVRQAVLRDLATPAEEHPSAAAGAARV